MMRKHIFKPRLSCDKRKLVPPKRTVVLAGCPNVQLRLKQRKRKRQAIAANGFGKRNHIRYNARTLKGKEASAAAAAHLNVVHNQ